MLEIKFPDGSVKQFKNGITPFEIAKSISNSLAKSILSASFNETTIELSTKLNENGNIKFFTWDNNEGKKAFWHSTAHVLAQVILEFYPKSKLTIGPAIDSGFYYDVDFGEEVFSENDFSKIEKRMIEISREGHDFKMRECSKDEAIKYYKLEKNKYKLELIEGIDDKITFCDHSNFSDLCRGGHLLNTKLIKSVKLLNVAGAYWRGNENNKQLTRIYGISFPKEKLLNEYIQLIEEAK